MLKSGSRALVADHPASVITDERAGVLSAPWTLFNSFVMEQLVSVRRLIRNDWSDSEQDGNLNVLAEQYLGRGEQEAWERLRGTASRRREWLLGRVVAKETLCDVLAGCTGHPPSPAEIEIVADQRGCPRVKAVLVDDLQTASVVSISHVGGVFVAAACATPGLRGIGIDIEQVTRVNEDVMRFAFSASELQLLQGLPAGAQANWPARLWCAKEAAGKALGVGLFSGLRDIHVSSVNATASIVEVEAREHTKGESSLQCGPADSLVVHTSNDGWLAAAVCLWNTDAEKT